MMCAWCFGGLIPATVAHGMALGWTQLSRELIPRHIFFVAGERGYNFCVVSDPGPCTSCKVIQLELHHISVSSDGKEDTP
ncbi:hypothetical protein J3E68DRAFT_396544 [Trichoderma sp. SZMC 28012]